LLQVGLEFLLQPFEKSPGGPGISCMDPKNDNFVVVDDRAHTPFPLVWLREEGQAPKTLQQQLAYPFDLLRFH
jgi:hypothetical protein